jgi:hypothetical protein
MKGPNLTHTLELVFSTRQLERLEMIAFERSNSRVHLPVDIPSQILGVEPQDQSVSALVALPLELQSKVFAHLEPIDKSCLALTCKSLARCYHGLRATAAAKPTKRVTRLKKLEYLLRFHQEVTHGVVPGYRLCYPCAAFRPLEPGWGGDTTYLRLGIASEKAVIKGPRCKSSGHVLAIERNVNINRPPMCQACGGRGDPSQEAPEGMDGQDESELSSEEPAIPTTHLNLRQRLG